MLANDRYLELESIDATYMGTNLVSPSAPLVVRFDREVDPSSIDGMRLTSGSTEVALSASFEGTLVRVQKDPYFDNATEYSLRLDGLRALDGSALADPVSFDFTTGTAPAGAMTIRGPGAVDGYTNSTTVSVSIEVNHEAEAYYLSNEPIIGIPTTGWNPIVYSDEVAAWDLESDESGERTVFMLLAGEGSIHSSVITGTVLRDNNPPTVNAGADIAINAQASLSGSASDSSGMQTFAWSGANLSFGTASASSTTVSGTAQGAQTALLTVFDNAGNAGTDTVTVTWDTVAPSVGTWVIASGAAYTNAATATISASSAPSDATSGLALVRFSNNGSLWSPWEAYSPGMSKSWTLTSATYGGTTTQGTKGVYVQVRDAAGNASTNASDTIVYDTGSPGAGSWTINSSETWTSNGTVNVNNSVTASDTYSGVAYVSFSNNGSTWSAWEAYSGGMTKSSWSMTSSTYGGTTTNTSSKYVYIRTKDGAGNISTTTSDYIGYDTVAPAAGSWLISSDAPYTTTPSSVSVAASSAPSDSLSGIYQMCFSNSSSGPWSGWETYSATKAAWNLTSATYGGNTDQGYKLAYVKVRDRALNESAYTSGLIVYDLSPTADPTSVSAASPTLDRTPTWEWTDTDPDGSVRYFQIQLDSTSGAWTSTTDLLDWTPSTALSDGLHTLYVRQKDVTWSYYSPYGSRTIRVTPVIPYSGQTGVSRTPTLSWRATLGASYTIQVYSGKIWSTLATTTSSAFTVPGTTPLAGSTTYTWRVAVLYHTVTTYLPSTSGATFTTIK